MIISLNPCKRQVSFHIAAASMFAGGIGFCYWLCVALEYDCFLSLLVCLLIGWTDTQPCVRNLDSGSEMSAGFLDSSGLFACPVTPDVGVLS